MRAEIAGRASLGSKSCRLSPRTPPAGFKRTVGKCPQLKLGASLLSGRTTYQCERTLTVRKCTASRSRIAQTWSIRTAIFPLRTRRVINTWRECSSLPTRNEESPRGIVDIRCSQQSRNSGQRAGSRSCIRVRASHPIRPGPNAGAYAQEILRLCLGVASGR
jgi:hypothetical protein